MIIAALIGVVILMIVIAVVMIVGSVPSSRHVTMSNEENEEDT